ncbi:furin-like protease kpc-1 [Mytilus trossulus]|uniref:furin-like protease kpc-1 n=1 Tax=Mytilus trossulus TaxID=6551 RepID=UPI003005FB6C
MDDNMYESEVQQLWNLNGSITPSQNIPITWESKSYTGKDQTIAFVELEYMQINHRDLVNQVVQDNTINWDYSNNSPYPTSPSPYVHGTYVAGVAIAQGGNDFCFVGVAPGATGIAISIGRKATDSDCASAHTHRLGKKVDIYNGSWGPKKFTAKFMHVPVCEFAMSEGGTKGRKGKGSIYVMSAGNDGPSFNTNTFSLRNSIYVIVVSAVNARREPPSYAPVGSSIMVAAYGGDDNLKVNLLNPISECSKMDSGTSIAAPTVSGVIALVLEARPDLSWRDIQHLIVCTANTNLKGTTITGRFRSDNIFIDCNSQTTCQNCGCKIKYLEHIKVKVTFSWNGERWFNAAYRGQVELYLISPRGTKSYILTNRPADRLQSETFTWEFKSVQSWGENPCGTFLLSFGTRTTDVTVKLESWHLTLYGTMEPPPSLQACSAAKQRF